MGTLFHFILPSWITGCIPSPSVRIISELLIDGSFVALVLNLLFLIPVCSDLFAPGLGFAIDLVAGSMISDDSGTDFTPFEERSKGAETSITYEGNVI